jgi:pimeloyl-ACP methyl ester carboxylesterase
MDLQTLRNQFSRRVSETAELGYALTCEAGASLLTCQLAPLGLSGRPLPLVPTLWSRPSRGSRPILFIHGIFHNPTALTYLRQKLAWQGWRHFEEINLFTTLRSVRRNAHEVARRVEKMRRKYSVSEVDIVAHSMGGILARYYVQLMEGDGIVRHLVTLGTPHRGTDWSRYSPLPHLRELAPESRTITALEQAPTPQRTRATAIAGNLDLFMIPRGCHWWGGARNVLLRGVGHAGLLFSKRVAQILVDQLEDSRPAEACASPSSG